MAETNNKRNGTLRKNSNKDTVGTGSKNNLNQDDEEEFFEACLLNCAYAEYQVDNEVVKKYTPTTKHKKKLEKPMDGRSMIQDVVLSVSSSGSSSFADDKSLLDLDSSSSLCSFDRNSPIRNNMVVETRQGGSP